jgi:hypothetical protein
MEAYQLQAKHLTPRRFTSNALFAETLNAHVQCTMSDAYLTVGTLRHPAERILTSVLYYM